MGTHVLSMGGSCEKRSLYRDKAGFIRLWETWKSHGTLKWLFKGLEKSLEKNKITKVLEYSWEFIIFIC